MKKSNQTDITTASEVAQTWRSAIYSVSFLLFYIVSSLYVTSAERGYAFGLSVLLLLPFLDYFWTSKKSLRELKMPSVVLLVVVIWITAVSLLGSDAYQLWRSFFAYGSLVASVTVLSQAKHPFTYRHLLTCFAYLNLAFTSLLLLGWLCDIRLGALSYMAGSRLSFTFGNPNYFAAVQLTLYVLFLGDAILHRHKDKNIRALSSIGAVVALMLIFLTGSRNAILWSALFTFSYGILIYRSGKLAFVWRHYYVVILSGCVGLFIWWSLTLGRQTLAKFSDLFAGGGASESGRFLIWSMVVDLWTRSPVATFFGSGWGSVQKLSMSYPLERVNDSFKASGFRHAHSEPLEVLLEGGVASLCLLTFLAVLMIVSWRRIRDHECRQQTMVLSIALLAWLAFSIFSVAPRYSAVLLPAVLILGLIFRNFPPLNLLPVGVSRIFTAALLSLVVGSIYISGRHFFSDVDLKKALLSEQETDAAHYYASAVVKAPDRISPRYRQFSFICLNPHLATREQVKSARAEMEAIIPNFKNTAEFHAEYLAATGDFLGAAEQFKAAAEFRPFYLMYLSDSLFYRWVAGSREAFREASRLLLLRAFLAEASAHETRGITAEVVLVDGYITVRGMSDTDLPSGLIRVSADLLAERIPVSLRTNQPIVRYYALAEASRVVQETLGLATAPAFFQALKPSDLDKVTRLAAKLDELSSRQNQ